ncbi:response regulator [Tahibacter amnicola]|uniref:Response regulator n=1 Tax=Tahibacter amnicola TaxID=2976241 RepID=A0ABY6BAX7_9GAMM|nr:response regulator [Tahibacter amnicola]UXI66305.1 response regulator [Tahibacter amnicola]
MKATAAPPTREPTRRVLIIEDEPSLAALLAETLAAESYDVSVLAEGGGAADWVRRNSPALVLLDLNLPDRDGFTVCREIRAFSSVPLIMITARVEEIDRLLGLEMGADDYICKPFLPREVVARVRALLRRVLEWRDAKPDSVLSLDESRFEAHWRGVMLDLTPVEFRLLRALGQHPGRVLSRAQLLDAIYVDDRAVSDRTIDSHIKNLRRKISDVSGGDDPLESVYGVGYKLDPSAARGR